MNVEGHLRTDMLGCFHLEVRRSHPQLDGAEGMLDSLTAYAHLVRVSIEPRFLPRDFRYEGEDAIEMAGMDQDKFQAWFARIPRPQEHSALRHLRKRLADRHQGTGQRYRRAARRPQPHDPGRGGPSSRQRPTTHPPWRATTATACSPTRCCVRSSMEWETKNAIAVSSRMSI
jgi:hypothetical protein